MNDRPRGVAAATQKLSDEQKATLRERYMSGAKVGDIAAEFGIVHGSVRYHTADLPVRPEDQERLIGPRPLELPTPPDWTEDARCANHPNPDVFFPVRPNGADKAAEHRLYAQTVAYAKGLCASCPVRFKCLEYALALQPVDAQGIWAGTTERDRERLRKKVVGRNAGANGRSRTMGNRDMLKQAKVKTAPIGAANANSEPDRTSLALPKEMG